MQYVSENIVNLIATQDPNVELSVKDTTDVLHLLGVLVGKVDPDVSTLMGLGPSFHGTYSGPITRLQGHTALLRNYKGVESQVGAQFDRQGLVHPDTGALLFIEWHQFDRADFQIDDADYYRVEEEDDDSTNTG